MGDPYFGETESKKKIRSERGRKVLVKHTEYNKAKVRREKDLLALVRCAPCLQGVHNKHTASPFSFYTAQTKPSSFFFRSVDFFYKYKFHTSYLHIFTIILIKMKVRNRFFQCKISYNLSIRNFFIINEIFSCTLDHVLLFNQWQNLRNII